MSNFERIGIDVRIYALPDSKNAPMIVTNLVPFNQADKSLLLFGNTSCLNENFVNLQKFNLLSCLS